MSKIIVGSVRRAANSGVLVCAMLALALQLFTSSMGYASNGMWIEICSDFGTEYVQVDLSDDPTSDQNGCPDCANCALCAVSLTGLPPASPAHFAFGSTVLEATQLQTQTVGPVFRRAWPETRGPPAANKNKADRALRAFQASIQENGGAL
ncbi:DUF2946 family protein [Aliiroseovarius sp. S1339]|uniref:DUF2946 family protein n=1 Tax=Aliiroseovarius sp. S1339 TaxID=2936990 RepID=UPI0020C05FC7|nr:DUF2946 family protein [Aliiroseovarius sp. S1339]MCK8465156.1 DUF2946 family protein [Aliiroseovarius sp. S1339]